MDNNLHDDAGRTRAAIREYFKRVGIREMFDTVADMEFPDSCDGCDFCDPCWHDPPVRIDQHPERFTFADLMR